MQHFLLSGYMNSKPEILEDYASAWLNSSVFSSKNRLLVAPAPCEPRRGPGRSAGAAPGGGSCSPGDGTHAPGPAGRQIDFRSLISISGSNACGSTSAGPGPFRSLNPKPGFTSAYLHPAAPVRHLRRRVCRVALCDVVMCPGECETVHHVPLMDATLHK